MSDEKNENPVEETVENVEAVLEEEISASEGDADAMSSELAALQKKADEHYDQLGWLLPFPGSLRRGVFQAADRRGAGDKMGSRSQGQSMESAAEASRGT